MALSADTPRNFSMVGSRNALPVQASSTIYAGSAVSIDTGGEVGPLAAAEVGFVGFAVSKVDNSAGSAGDVNADIITSGEIELTVTGLDDNNDLGDIVYASDDTTFTLTSATANTAVGKVSQIVSLTDNKCRVKFTSLHNEHWND